MFDHDSNTQYGTMFCEECGESEDFPGSFIEALTAAKDAGWEVSRDDILGEWHHTCPNC